MIKIKIKSFKTWMRYNLKQQIINDIRFLKAYKKNNSNDTIYLYVLKELQNNFKNRQQNNFKSYKEVINKYKTYYKNSSYDYKYNFIELY